MKVLTLHQPWATLVAEGAKRWETRSWQTSYRGPLAIHCGRSFPPAARSLCAQPPFAGRLLAATLADEEMLRERPTLVFPRGSIIAVTWLEDVIPAECVPFDEDADEWAFGDYSPGRYAWKLREPISFAPIFRRGYLGLWNVPDELIPEYARRAIRHPGVPA